VSYRDRINAVVQSLGAELGSPLSLAADGSLSLEFGGGRHCQLAVSDTEARVSLFAPIAAVHADTSGPLFEAALLLNADPTQTGDVIIGYDPDQRELVVATSVEGETDAERLSAVLNDFLHSALALEKKLNEALQTHRAEGTAETGAPFDHTTGEMIKV